MPVVQKEEVGIAAVSVSPQCQRGAPGDGMPCPHLRCVTDVLAQVNDAVAHASAVARCALQHVDDCGAASAFMGWLFARFNESIDACIGSRDEEFDPLLQPVLKRGAKRKYDEEFKDALVSGVRFLYVSSAAQISE